MTKRTTITLFYTGIAAICAGVISLFIYLAKRPSDSYQVPVVVNTGKETVQQWFPIGSDLTAKNQANETVKLSDLRGKVWVVAEFFAVCPNCAVRNGQALRQLYDEFKNNPDFQIVCISVDPENDGQERLADYAKALGAETKNWWFLNAGDAKTTHEYLEGTLKFMKIRERTDPADIETNGKYVHDMGFGLVDRNFEYLGKWQLADSNTDFAKSIDPNMQQKLKDELFNRIRTELAKKDTVGN